MVIGVKGSAFSILMELAKRICFHMRKDKINRHQLLLELITTLGNQTLETMGFDNVA